MTNHRIVSVCKFENGVTMRIKWPGTGKPLNQASLLIKKPNGEKMEVPLLNLRSELDKRITE